MASYTLEDARAALKDRLLWLSAQLTREPLEGLVDSSNKVFHLRYAPAQESSVNLYNSTGAAVATTAYTLDEAAGSVVFNTAPTGAHTASYTYQAHSDTALLGLCKEGFDTMQRVYPRALYIVNSTSEWHISSTSASVADPTLGSVLFSASRIQQDFLVTCCEYALVKAKVQQAGVEAISFREGITGMQVDRSRRVASLTPGLDDVKERLEQAAFAAADDANDTSLFEGGVSPGARSDTWADWYDWWTDGQQDRGVIA